jgi:hypothetical protein
VSRETDLVVLAQPDDPRVFGAAHPSTHQDRFVRRRRSADRLAIPVQRHALIACDPDVVRPAAVHREQVLLHAARHQRQRLTIEVRDRARGADHPNIARAAAPDRDESFVGRRAERTACKQAR